MDKKYQVFVSSTYADLVEERQAVSRAILDMGHIPAGMEMFPAADVEQLVYIKKVIDECDYYVVIVGGRYGSTDESGISYTEHEFNYALETSKTVLAFIHRDIDTVLLGKTDKSDEKREKLANFISRLQSGRLVQFWSNALELRANAIVSITKAFSQNPQIGWVRADAVATSSAMSDIVKYRDENDKLKEELKKAKGAIVPKFENIADFSAIKRVNYTYLSGTVTKSGSKEISFGDLLIFMAPELHTPSTINSIELALKRAFKERLNISSERLSLKSSDVQDVMMHLVATKHVTMWPAKTLDGKGHVTGYQLTPLGVRYWQESTYARSQSEPDPTIELAVSD